MEVVSADAAKPPSLACPISQACTMAQCDTPVYRGWCEEIRETPRYHRKQWEFCYILQALTVTGAMLEGHRGLGFGVGVEPLTAVLAAHGCQIVATDLDTKEAARAGWVATDQHAAHLTELNTRGICDPEFFSERVSFRFVDMRNIPPDLKDFDFTWSACCLEHLGSISNGLAFIENSLKALRPGGVAVHTTELNCSSNEKTLDEGGTVLFRKRDIEALCTRLRSAGHEVELNFYLGDQPLDTYVDVAPYSADRHLKLQIGAYTSTSFGIIVRKGARSSARSMPPRRRISAEGSAKSFHWPTRTRSLVANALEETGALRQEIVALRRDIAALARRAEMSPEPTATANAIAKSHDRISRALPMEVGSKARPFYYLGRDRALTQLSTGDPFFVNTRDRGVTTWIVYLGEWETFVDGVLCALAAPGQVVIDVGANQGYYTIKLARLVGETGAVFGFEPNPELYSVLADNVSINGLSSYVRVYQLAAGDAPGESTLRFAYGNMGGGHVAAPGSDTPENSEGDEGHTIAVEVARIDDILPAGTTADLIKIDAEGYEPLVLRGMKQTLARSPDAAILLEVNLTAWTRFGDPTTLLEEARGTRTAYWVDHDGRLTPLTVSQIGKRLTIDAVSYVLLLPPRPERLAAIAKFVR